MDDDDDLPPIQTVLTDAEKAALQPRFLRLAICYWCGCLLCCCTACASWLPYSLYKRSAESRLKGRAESQDDEESEGPKSLSIEGPQNMV